MPFLWLASLGIMLAVIFGPYDYARTGVVESQEFAGFYAGLFRSAWAVGVAGTILLCAHGCGGIINTFLSWRMWVPLSRLTYVTYLIHEFVLGYMYSSRRLVEHGSHL